MATITLAGLVNLLAQVDLSNFTFPGGVRGFTGFTMLTHMFFAELFVGFAIAAPVLQAWGARTGSPRMDRLAHSMVRFNVLTFSTGATFAVLFVVLGFFFAVTTPSIGIPTFIVFLSLAAILLAGSYSRVGAQPILTDMEAPREEAGTWNDAFEVGRVLVFATTTERRLLRPIRETLQANGASFYIVDRRLEPRAVGQAVMHRAGASERQSIVQGT